MMSIKEKGYSHWDGELEFGRFPWKPITRSGIRLTFKKRFFKFFFFMALFPTAVFLAMVYISERIEDFSFMIRERNLISVDPAFFQTFLSNDYLFFMMIMILIFAGSGLISDDLRHNALQLYFSRPLSKKDYFLGKITVLVFFFFILTLIPSLFLFLMKLVFSGSFSFFGSFPWLPISIIIYSVIITLFFSCYGLLLSSLSKNRRYVAVLIFGIYFASDIFFGIFYGIFRDHYFSLLSMEANLQQIASMIFKGNPTYDVSWVYSMTIIIGFCLVSIWMVHRRIKGVEVVK